jgi:hypothetical protein
MAGIPSVGVLFTIGNCRNSVSNASAVQSSLLIFRTSLHHGEDSAELQVFIGNPRACVSLRSFYIFRDPLLPSSEVDHLDSIFYW